MLVVIIAIILNFIALYLIFHYFKWKLTSFNFLENFEKKKEEIGSEINLMIIELNKTTERNLQILEAKMGQLNEVVSRAEKIFSAFKKEKEITETSENIYQKLERKSINDAIEKAVKVKVKEDEAKPELLDNTKIQKEDLREKVIEMYKNGIDIELISGKLGITKGEVELIISISEIK
ncbi:MAG: hypothetical protein FWE72_02020 [Spirochaetaceae bacterium]|nr:hypothetical protein [Spirochaetaceae bacterium]